MTDKREVPVYCYQCVAGPDLMKVEVEDVVATRIVSNFVVRDEHPGGGGGRRRRHLEVDPDQPGRFSTGLRA